MFTVILTLIFGTEIGNNIHTLEIITRKTQRMQNVPENSENMPWGLYMYFSKALFEGLIFGGAYLWREI